MAWLLEGDSAVVRPRFSGTRLVTSALTSAEAARAIVRARTANRVSQAQVHEATLALQRFWRRCHVMAVDDAVLARAGRPFPVEPVRTLDAVHLATAERLADTPELVTVVTRDERVRANALALGFAVE